MTNNRKSSETKCFVYVQKAKYIHDKTNDITFLNRNVVPKAECSTEDCIKSLQAAVKRSKNPKN